MKANSIFLNQAKSFWANVRSLSEEIGYTRSGRVTVPTINEMKLGLERLNLGSLHIIDENNKATELGNTLIEYFQFRADQLNNYVNGRLMDVKRASTTFDQLKKKLKPKCPLPMNKQKGAMKAPAYFTGIINMLIEANAGGLPCDYDPRKLTSVTHGAFLLEHWPDALMGHFQRQSIL